MFKKIFYTLVAFGVALTPGFCFATTTDNLVEAGGAYSVVISTTPNERYQISATNDLHHYTVSGDNLVDDALTISELKFHDYGSQKAYTKENALGITGTVANQSNKNLLFNLDIVYYDSSNRVVAATNTYHLAPANKTVQFVSMESSDRFRLFSQASGGSFEITVPTSMQIKIDAIYDADQVRDTTAASEQENVSGTYVYDDYRVLVNVHQDESFDVHESMTAYFRKYSHGIIRHLPSRYTTDTIGTRRARLDNISVDQPFTKSNNTSEHQIDVKIGDPDTMISGHQAYNIKYTYALDKDNMGSFDEFYFNLIDDTVDISNISFEVTMPSKFDISRIGFSSGSYGNRNNNVVYYVEDNKIVGYYDGILHNGAVTLRIVLDNDYFDNEGLPYVEPGSWALIGLVAPLVFLALTFVLWYLFGRDERHPETVEFYPPDDMNSLDIQFYYKGKVDSDGVVSLLTYLANKGYLTIEKQGAHSSSFVIRKLRDYDGNHAAEREFMQKLFPGGRTTTKASQLRNSFYRTVDRIIKDYNNKDKKSKIFVTNNGLAKVITVLCVIATVITPIVASIMDFDADAGAIGALFAIFVVMAIYSPFYIIGFNIKGIAGKIIVLGFISFHAFLMLGGIVNDMLDELLEINPIYIGIIVLSILCAIIEVILVISMPKRNEYGARMYARVNGFRNFLQTAERTRLEMLVGSDPSYFYNIIPYAYSLGVSKKWMRQFEDIMLSTPPEWYVSGSMSSDSYSSRSFDYREFRSFMDHTVSSVSHSMTSSPSSSGGGGGSGGSSSGGSSGGGSSGGGGGGGGSSSW